MKKWIENQGPLKKLGKEVHAFVSAMRHKIQTHSLYQSIQSRIGEKKMYGLNAGVIFLLIFALAQCGRSGNRDKQNTKPPVPVMTAKIRKGAVPLYLKTIGTVTPFDSVSVRTQINGRLLSVHFQEGQLVTKGQVLAEIDPRPYEALLKQYKGQLVRDQALLSNARLDLKRYKKLYAQDSISRQALDTQIHLVKQYEGTVSSDQGLVDGAQVNLHYCQIISNISGMIGLRQVNPGNFVQTMDTTPIATVNAISPITVVFSIPEDELRQVQEKVRNNISLVVDAFDRKEENLLATGRLLALDSQIDNTTGTIKLKASFANEDYRLFPNQFVNVRLKVDTLNNALIAPTAAVQTGREGLFVYVVNEETKSVSIKPVTIKVSMDGDASLSGDLAEGQSVVIQGTDKLSDGASVILSQAEGQGSKGQSAL